ncbi:MULTISPECIES: replication-associated recombination protein A [unclassified Campylobacter]|uniref:replication-associated recombination protein A n=1 Tax=unclassified Campylobacter TaxID=2593542 RepID=UPI001237F9A4|nr:MULTISPECIES: replication-associated recombination protein A [unclassified Campylobacter]KAA6227179.1 replication-associated recombination protein A [Campylobacter sp. LR286c]KAA6227946.1 replication-associated recombination protein A [Campylobacter sp. LR185c]KAA6228356.1 replication-associated recombination protein A [Campylobacter sp. LR196d]KAA6229357.1 replication-associated recombination protein A [Campylobacter sp. LR291e]KAA6231163.1 replication-associated recombination protein A [C
MTSLALEFRPKNLDEILGQESLVEVFEKFIDMKKLPHSIFFGPAGCGKTTFARVVANAFGLDFYEFDGGNFKLESLRTIINRYSESLYKPLIFIDEIHRLSKTQQEMLLIPMENYRFIIIGASTENPYFVLSSGIRSRSMLFEFKPLNYTHLEKLLLRVQNKLNFSMDEDAREFLLKSADARAVLNLLEFVLVFDDRHISLANLKRLRPTMQSEGVSSKDTHYILISALIKSMRGSDVDASLYYLARLINDGESADFIARRLVIFASEDIGNADTNALNLAINTLIGVKNIGYPEARILLGQCVVYLASAIKSNSSYMGIDEALNFVKNNKALEIPAYLDNNSPQKQKYLYPHDFGGWVNQKYISKDIRFYKSKGKGDESRLLDNLFFMKNQGID